jgi:hypothetical protein
VLAVHWWSRWSRRAYRHTACPPGAHLHVFGLHRHGPWPGHKPHPERRHAHVWWRHTHPRDGVARIAAEHDADHDDGLFAREASIYLRWVADVLQGKATNAAKPSDWPASGCAWKPTTLLRALEKAGALAAAEIDRIGDGTS